MKIVRFALALAVLVGVAGCSSPDEQSRDFAVWARTLKYVASVDATPQSGSSGPQGMTAHLAIDGAIGSDELVSLAQTLAERADSKGISPADINLIVGNAWGFSVDEDGVNVATINQLRDAPAFVGATIDYQPLDVTPGYTPGLRGTVGSQAALRDAFDGLITAYTAAGGTVGDVPVSASTANGAFAILGTGDAQPLKAIALWQAISGRVLPLAVEASLADGQESLALTVATAEEKATAESIGAQFPDVTLTVTQ